MEQLYRIAMRSKHSRRRLLLQIFTTKSIHEMTKWLRRDADFQWRCRVQ